MGHIIRKIALAALLASGSITANAGYWETESAGGFQVVHKYTPDSIAPVGDGLGLMIVLHGCTQPASSYRTANLDVVAENESMLIAVPEAVNRQGFDCWDTTGAKGRSVGDYKRLIDLVKEYTAESSEIDPNKVYIAGLNSGGVFARNAWCMAPDVFAGLGTMGATFSTGQAEAQVIRDPSEVAQQCLDLAGEAKNYFADSKAVVACGGSDGFSPYSHCKQAAEAIAWLIDSSSKSVTESVDDIATETTWVSQDGIEKTALLYINGVESAWPGGAGATGSYIDNTSLNFGEYLGEFLRPDYIVPCLVRINGFQMEESYVIKEGETVNVAGGVEVIGGCKFESLSLVLNEQRYQFDTSVVDLDMAVSEGQNELIVEADVRRDNGAWLTDSIQLSFDVEYKVEVPSWCSYFPEMYWSWLPSCAAGLK